MKESYFISKTLSATAKVMRRENANLVNRHARQFEPPHAALLVLDMQDYFLLPESHAFIPSAPAILPNIQKLVETFYAKQLPVIFTQHLNTPENARSMGRWWRDLLSFEHPLKNISTALDTSQGILLSKPQYDAFYQTRLEDILREQNIEQVVISGVMTHLCCETTARSAFMRGFEVFFCIDGTATYNRTFHLATLTNLSHGFAVPVLVDEILSVFQETSDG